MSINDDISWSERSLKNDLVLVTGRIGLVCGHGVRESARVRNSTRDIEQGKKTIANLINDLVRSHMNQCKRLR